MTEPSTPPPSPGLITVVDDEAALRSSLSRLIRSFGYEVDMHESANAFLNSNSLDESLCLILDVRMPGLSGLDLQDILIKLNVSIPIIFMTGYVDEEIRAQALKKGAVGFLEKPFPEKDLFDLLQKHLPSPPRPKTRR